MDHTVSHKLVVNDKAENLWGALAGFAVEATLGRSVSRGERLHGDIRIELPSCSFSFDGAEKIARTVLSVVEKARQVQETQG